MDDVEPENATDGPSDEELRSLGLEPVKSWVRKSSTGKSARNRRHRAKALASGGFCNALATAPGGGASRRPGPGYGDAPAPRPTRAGRLHGARPVVRRRAGPERRRRAHSRRQPARRAASVIARPNDGDIPLFR